MKKNIFLFPVILLLLIIVCSQNSCAVIVPPGGGPKDSLPPVLVNALPTDSALNVTTNRIILNFDEYVTLDNAQENLLVSPYPSKTPTVTSHLKTISILLRDSLKPNTTYSLNFGKGLKDNNEGNIARNFTYVFSTGDHLDMDSITGRVLLAETGKPDSTLIVMLHSNLSDTAVEKLSPNYVAKLDSAGHFAFHFLPVGDYNIFVLQNDYAKKYTDSTQIFGFHDQVLHITDSTMPGRIQLYAYQEEKPVDTKAKNNGQPQQSRKPKKEKPKPLTVTTSLKDTKQDLLTPFSFEFSQPLRLFDSTKIVLTDTNYVKINGYRLSKDSSDTTNRRFKIQFPWKENQSFVLTIDTLAAKDSSGIGLAKIDTIPFSTQPNAAYASIRLSFPDVDVTQHPVLQILQANSMVDSIVIPNNKLIIRQLYPSGDYEFRILYDKNQNLQWDPGNYKKKLQPEIVEYIKKKFTFKPNWDNEQEIYLHGSGK